jgi:hypothetical protein
MHRNHGFAGWCAVMEPARSKSARMLAAVVAAGLTGCSIHPLPDDVSPIPTENIVAAARCEMRLGLAKKVRVWFFEDIKLPKDDPLLNPFLAGDNLDKIIRKYSLDAEDWKNTMAVSVAFEWMFDISETNQVDGDVGFRLPFINPTGTLDVGASGKVNTIRRGVRTFKNQETFGNMLTKDWKEICNDRDNSGDEMPIQPIPQPKRWLYPITGSIGLERVVKTFLSIASWEDALDTFVDEITFTTTLYFTAPVVIPADKNEGLVAIQAAADATTVTREARASTTRHRRAPPRHRTSWTPSRGLEMP